MLSRAVGGQEPGVNVTQTAAALAADLNAAAAGRAPPSTSP